MPMAPRSMLSCWSDTARSASPGEPHGGDAERVETDQLDNIDRGAVGIEGVQILAGLAPAEIHVPWEVEGESLQVVEVLGGDRGRGEAAVADDLRRHALADLRFGAAVRPEAPVRMRVHVDEAGRHPPSRDVEGAPRRLAREIADGGDRLVANADIRAASRPPRAIDDRRALELQGEQR